MIQLNNKKIQIPKKFFLDDDVFILDSVQKRKHDAMKDIKKIQRNGNRVRNIYQQGEYFIYRGQHYRKKKELQQKVVKK